MQFDTQTAAEYAAKKLDSLLERAARDSAAIVEQADIPETVRHFSELRDIVQDLATKMTALQAHINQLSYELIPTMFSNQGVKTIKVDDVGRATINDRWSASMLNKDRGMGWLRETGNDGIIIETVNSQTLGAFAKEQTLAGKPLPQDVFKVSSTPFVSITKG